MISNEINHELHIQSIFTINGVNMNMREVDLRCIAMHYIDCFEWLMFHNHLRFWHVFTRLSHIACKSLLL